MPLRECEILVSALLEFVSSRRPSAVNMSVVAGPQSGVEREKPRLVLWEGNRSPSGKVGAEEPEGDEENDVAVSGEEDGRAWSHLVDGRSAGEGLGYVQLPIRSPSPHITCLQSPG